MTFEERENML
jgi:hypothetical protein